MDNYVVLLSSPQKELRFVEIFTKLQVSGGYKNHFRLLEKLNQHQLQMVTYMKMIL
jgi:hypothetical protein